MRQLAIATAALLLAAAVDPAPRVVDVAVPAAARTSPGTVIQVELDTQQDQAVLIETERGETVGSIVPYGLPGRGRYTFPAPRLNGRSIVRLRLIPRNLRTGEVIRGAAVQLHSIEIVPGDR